VFEKTVWAFNPTAIQALVCTVLILGVPSLKPTKFSNSVPNTT